MFTPRKTVDATAVTLDQITPALLRSSVVFTMRRSWSGKPGYDEVEVDDLLDLLADWSEALIKENETLRYERSRLTPGDGLVVIDHPWSPTMVEKPKDDRYEEIGVTYEHSDD